MKTVYDSARKARYIKELDIERYFSSKVPDFLLLRYLPGEMLTSAYSPSQYVQFVAEGELLLYDMPDEEHTITIQTTHNDVNILGEMELLDARFTPFFVEASSVVYTLALRLDQYREQLLSDPVFLRRICLSLAEKLNGAVSSSARLPLKVKVCRSIRLVEPGQRITGIGQLAKSVNVSNRQMLRVLKELCLEGVLEHEKKGVYRVLKQPGENMTRMY